VTGDTVKVLNYISAFCLFSPTDDVDQAFDSVEQFPRFTRRVEIVHYLNVKIISVHSNKNALIGPIIQTIFGFFSFILIMFKSSLHFLTRCAIIFEMDDWMTIMDGTNADLQAAKGRFGCGAVLLRLGDMAISGCIGEQRGLQKDKDGSRGYYHQNWSKIRNNLDNTRTIAAAVVDGISRTIGGNSITRRGACPRMRNP
jgi:hypothetical protein